jgi:hypothetical protein
MGIKLADFSPLYGAVTGKGAFGDLLGKQSKMADAKAAQDKIAADEKAAKEKAAAEASAQQWANRPAMKKGGMAKKADGGSVYTEKMGKPPQDVDGASVRKSSKRDQPEQLGEGIRVEKKASGGMTASRRADGIATKGKTRGKMC